MARGLLPDNWNFASNTPCLHRGGDYNRNQNYGMFYLNYNSASNANANIGSRLQYAGDGRAAGFGKSEDRRAGDVLEIQRGHENHDHFR